MVHTIYRFRTSELDRLKTDVPVCDNEVAAVEECEDVAAFEVGATIDSIKKDLDTLFDPSSFVGTAPEQVNSF